jgi:hypothetical protein
VFYGLNATGLATSGVPRLGTRRNASLVPRGDSAMVTWAAHGEARDPRDCF